MYRMEIHPGEGGDDAQQFARELGSAVAAHTGTKTTMEGRVVVLAIPVRL